MNLDNITPQGYILAMIIRDDGERILLGDGAYVFKDSQQHFQPNTFANDVVELQGTDGQLLAGQVRRTAIQTFAGYIGDASTSQQRVEQYRKQFLMFFRKKFHYTAVYIFHDGSAIQRKRGYIATAPAVPELYQKYPEWSVGLNFEDTNYYEYAEDDEGNEIYAHAVQIAISNAVSGGLIWDNNGATSDELGYTGTPIDGNGKNFQLTNTSDKILKSAELLGDAEQTTYSGKNKLPVQFDYTETMNSVTIKGSADGFVLNGTASANTTFILPIVGTYTTVSGDYFHLGNSEAKSGSSITLAFTDSTSTSPGFTVANRIFSLNGYYGKTINSANMFIPSGTVFNNFQLKPMILNSSTATPYEPYVGGTASPNPDYPQAVNIVTGEQTVKIEGKNLVNQVEANSFVGSSGNISTSGSSDYLGFNFASHCQPSTSYSVSFQHDEATANLYIGFWDENGNFITRTGFGTSRTFTTPNNAHTLFCYLYKTGAFPTVGGWLQLELGSTATTYEPYQGQEYEVNLGKNLLQITSVSGFFYSAGLPVGSTDRVVIDDFSDNKISFSVAQSGGYVEAITNIIQLRPNTQYTLSFKKQTTLSDNQTFIYGYDNGQYTLIYRDANTGVLQQSFTTPANGQIRLGFGTGGASGTATISDIQIELGSQATSYAPYFTPIELAKIDTYQDRIYKTGGKWYIEKQVGKEVFDSSTLFRWSVYGTGTANYMYLYQTISNSVAGAVLMSNYGQKGNVSPANTEEGILIVANGLVRIRIGAEISLDDWKAKLTATPMVLYYQLATPTTTEITNSTLIDQLNALQHANTYTDLTNFSTSSVYLNGFLSVKAYPKGGTPTGGYIWEAGGAGGPTTLTVDGVDNAYPIWTVPGPATNPTLTNITTGQTISWTGTVPNGQELVIDMANQTASLSGANVFEFVSGSWLTLEPGNNRISYSAVNATDPSKLEWNGVTG